MTPTEILKGIPSTCPQCKKQIHLHMTLKKESHLDTHLLNCSCGWEQRYVETGRTIYIHMKPKEV